MKTVFAAFIMTGFLLFAGGPRAYANCSFEVINCSDKDVYLCAYKGNDWIHLIAQDNVFLPKVTKSASAAGVTIPQNTLSCSHSNCDVGVSVQRLPSIGLNPACGPVLVQNTCDPVVFNPVSDLIDEGLLLEVDQELAFSCIGGPDVDETAISVD